MLSNFIMLSNEIFNQPLINSIYKGLIALVQRETYGHFVEPR